MRVSILRHNYCDGSCTFYHHWAHAHFFTFFGIRVVIGKPRGDTDQEKIENWVKQQNSGSVKNESG